MAFIVHCIRKSELDNKTYTARAGHTVILTLNSYALGREVQLRHRGRHGGRDRGREEDREARIVYTRSPYGQAGRVWVGGR